ncbi:MAG TPA: hypothetical protein VJO99_25255 [Burkholderiaceae bacterium]|nr:hypothetical protein [Burkholderiaceae bacterium]
MQDIRQSQNEALEIERNGYNVAFSELGLEWYWDAETYSNLQTIPEESRRVRTYLETHQPHLLRAYDADFLVNAIQGARARFTAAMAT